MRNSRETLGRIAAARGSKASQADGSNAGGETMSHAHSAKWTAPTAGRSMGRVRLSGQMAASAAPAMGMSMRRVEFIRAVP